MFEVEEWLHSRIGLNFRSGLGHDFGTQRALLRLVGKRRALLEYLKEVDIERYRAIVKTLNLRR